MNISARPKHVPALDGLRGLAILMIFCLHYFPRVELFSIGWTGVDLFFVLSGYLITGRLLSTLHEPGYLRKFYRNRILRIFPLYYGTLIIFFISIWLISNGRNENVFSYYFAHWKSFFILTENWTFIRYGPPDEGYLMHFWTLAIEEQFYIFWPLVVYFISPSRYRVWICGTMIIGVIILRVSIYNYYPANMDWHVFHYNSFCRMDSFIIGAVLYQLGTRESRIPDKWIKWLLPAISLMTFVGIVILKNAHYFEPFKRTIGYSFVALFFAWIIQLAVRDNSTIARIFNFPFLRFCGKISYGLYIVHWPVILIIGGWMTDWALLHPSVHYLTIEMLSALFSIIISFGFSWLSYRYFESYFLSLKKV